MHKYKLLLTFVMLCTVLMVHGFTKSPYTEDMESLNLNAPNLGMRGWTHQVDSHQANGTVYTVAYTNGHYYGNGGSYALGVTGSQTLGPTGNQREVNDLVITPPISGTLSFWAKGTSGSYTPSVKLYNCTDNGDGTFAIGDEISYDTQIIYSQGKVVTVPGEFDNEHVAFRLEYVYLDDVKATSAELDPLNSMQVNSASTTASGTIYADSRNSVTIPVTVSLTNNGDMDLTQGQQGYNLLLFRGTSSTLSSATQVASVAIPGDLAVGETKTFTIDFRFTPSGSGSSFLVVDPYSYSYKALSSYITIVEYAPKLKLDRDQTTNYEPIPLDLGFAKPDQPTSVTVKLINDGGAPLTGLEYEAPDGFTVSGITEIPARGGELDVTVSLNATEPGWYSGALTFKHATAGSQTVQIRGLVQDPDLWAEDFEATSMPGNYVVGDYWSISNTPEVISSPGNRSWATHTGQYATYKSQFVTPKIEVAAGDDPLQVFAGRKGGRYDTYSELSVKYSADRENWTEALYVQDSSTNSEFGNEMLSSDNVNLFKRFTVAIPEGEWFLAFEGRYVNIAHITGYHLADVAHDVMHVSHTLPTEGTVNNPYNATLKLKNMNTRPETDYTVKLYADGQEVAKAVTEEFAAGEEREFTITYYPHATGTVKVKAVFATGDYEYATEEVDVNVKPEVAREEKQIGTTSTSYVSAYLPINAYYRYCESQFKYTADQLDIPEGTAIVSLAFLGRILSHSAATDVDVAYEVYASEEGTTSFTSPYSLMSYDAMNHVATGTQHYDKDQVTDYNMDNRIFEVTFDEPYIYHGGDLTFAFSSACGPGQSKNNINFALFNVAGQAIERHNDYDVANGSLGSARLPVIIIGTQKSSGYVSGTVTSNGEPVEGANVRFSSGEVYYESTTDADGHYSLNIMQLDRRYKVTATAPGLKYEEEDEAREIPEGESTVDIAMNELPKTMTLHGQVIDIETEVKLEGVAIAISSADREATYSTTTDANGDYSVEITEPDATWTAVFTLDGYRPLTLTAEGREGEVLLNGLMTPLFVTVSGTVTDTEENPIAAASITFTCGDRHEEPTVTGTDGKYSYRINNPGEDEWTVTASAERYTLVERKVYLNDEEITVDFVLEKTRTDGVSTVEAAGGLLLSLDGRTLVADCEIPQQITIVTTDGKLIFSDFLTEGRHILTTLEPGLYIISGRKILVK